MTQSLNQQLESLRRLTLSIRQQLEQAEAYVLNINDVVRQLLEIGLLQETLLLGDIIHQGNYDPRYGNEDSGWLLQAALGIGHGGVGVVFWDTEWYCQFVRFDEPITSEVESNFKAFENCTYAVKGLLLPQLYPLVTRMCQLVKI